MTPFARRLTTALSLALALALPATARAHAVVYPKASATGAYEKYVLRVPNEKGAATTRVELRFPAGLRVISFADVPGWTVETVKDSSGAIVAAVWTGTLAAQRFVELPFIAVNPKTATRLVWPTFQSYADGQRVEWTGPEGSKSPASATDVSASPAAGAGGPASSVPLWLGGIAVVMSLVSLGLALRRREGM